MIKMVNGTAQPSEADAFGQWMAESTAHREEFRQFRQLWGDLKGPWPQATDRAPLASIRQRVLTNKRKRQKRKMIVYAAALMAVLATGLWLTRGQEQTPFRENLSFNNVTLQELASTLEDRFHAHINIEDKELVKCRFTGSFYKTSTVEDIMRTIAFSLNLEIKTKGAEQYEWKGHGC
jgi:ferric-dicitrate binding protein FerR (iron transport regulator)